MEAKVRSDVLLKFGVAVVLSVVGFVYTRFRTSLFQDSSSLGHDEDDAEVDSGGNTGLDPHGLQRITSSDNIQSEKNHVETITSPNVSTDNPIVDFSPKFPGDKKSTASRDNCITPRDNYTLHLPDFDKNNKFHTSSTFLEVSSKGNADVGTQIFLDGSCMADIEQENRFLKNIIRVLRERENCLEFQLLEYYGLKEQESAVMELQNQLKIRNMDAKLLHLKIQSLQTDNKMLAADNAKLVAELEMAHNEIESLNSKLRCQSEELEQILMLQQRVTKLQDEVQKSLDPQLQKQRLKDLESEVSANPHGNFESGQIRSTSALDDDSMVLMEAQENHLEEENKRLTKEVERLQADEFGFLEELVYLRWLNACLRYELRAYQPAEAKTILARDLSKSLCPESEKKAKQLILEYAANNIDGSENVLDFDSDHWCCSSSEEANSSELAETSSSTVSIGSSSSTKMKIVKKLRRVVTGRESKCASSMESVVYPGELLRTDAQSRRFLDSSRRSATPSLKSELMKYALALKGTHGLDGN